ADRGEVVRGRAGNDAVEVVGEALRFHHGLASAVRAAGEVRLGFGRAVIAADDRLRDLRRAMDGEVAEVDQTLRVVECPFAVGDAALMAGVGADSRVAVVDGRAGLV